MGLGNTVCTEPKIKAPLVITAIQVYGSEAFPLLNQPTDAIYVIANRFKDQFFGKNEHLVAVSEGKIQFLNHSFISYLDSRRSGLSKAKQLLPP
jgi:hypothetical protein